MTIWEPGFFWLLCWFFESTPPPLQFPSQLHVTHSLRAPSDLKVDEYHLCFRATLVSKKIEMHVHGMLVTHTCACACLKTQANTCLLDHAVPLHNTSQGWLLFCSASKNVLSPFPPLLFLPVFFHYGGRNCGWDSRPSLPTACPDY